MGVMVRSPQTFCNIVYVSVYHTYLFLCNSFLFPMCHFLISDFLPSDAAQIINIDFVQLWQQVLYPVIPDWAYSSHINPRGDQNIMENDPV